ncbi:glycosyltransferase 87 family protein [Flexivirga meconopsidis]|uniref:glycosyltransferase 87 family protein n=1 Tax=Flexivirga meconopsidis TaxID=2977121 RepID=UPI002240AF59|nr:glycosyltransferase 87 family protein [Flexivirga meconopsidis]
MGARMQARSRDAGQLRMVLLIAALWLASRCAMLLIHRRETDIDGDIGYFSDVLQQHDIGSMLTEYPTPVVGLMWPMHLIAGDDGDRFRQLFVGTMLVLDLLFTAYLVRIGARSRDYLGAFAWIGFGLCLGPLVIFRFDLLPGIFAALAIGLSARAPVRAGICAALGFAFKLWPIVLVPLLATRGRQLRRSCAAAALTVVVLVDLSLVIAGAQRTLSPLTWQRDRGLQVESLVATPLMLDRLLRPDRWRIDYAHNAWEINGPWTSAAQTAAGGMIGLSVCVVAFLWWRCFRVRHDRPELTAWLCLAVICLIIVSDKTFSPQYLLWIAPPAALVLATWPRVLAPRVLMGAVLVIGLTTQQLYPVHYNAMIATPPSALSVWLLIARNVMLLAVTVGLCTYVWRQSLLPTRSAQDEGDEHNDEDHDAERSEEQPARRRG